MLDHLPHEIALLILEDLAPAPLVHLDYHEAQKTLRHLCLVSRRYRGIAQPVFWRSLFFVERTRFDQFAQLEGTADLLAHVRHLAVVPDKRAGVPPEDKLGLKKVETILPLLPNLESLWINAKQLDGDIDRFRLTAIKSNTHLEVIHLSDVCLNPAIFKRWFRSASLPALRAFYHDVYTLAFDRFTPHVDPDLLSQLDFVQTDGVEAGHKHSASTPLAAETRWPSPLFVPLHVLVEVHQSHGRVIDRPDWSESGLLSMWARELSSTAHPPADEPASLWIPRSALRGMATSPEVVATFNALQVACERAGRRLFWWDGELGEGELVSHEFWRYARGLRAARATVA
ncbi:hypothetical protein JCM10449v2_003234 [Rhodotorula kratochvilovae]